MDAETSWLLACCQMKSVLSLDLRLIDYVWRA